MPWGAVIGAAVSLYGNSQSNKAAKNGADAQQKGSQAAIDEQRRQFDLTRGDMAPWLQAGKDALGKQSAFLNGDWSGFENSPDYKYALQQGIDGIDSSAAARGGLFGGGNTRDITRFATGLATQNADNYYAKLTGMSNTGNSTGKPWHLGANMAATSATSTTTWATRAQSAYNQIGNNNAQTGAAIGGAINQYGQYQGWWG
jgi:hypothetical protein